MEPATFERLCQRIMRESGFVQVEVTAKNSSAGGIEGVGVLRMNLISLQVLFQYERWKGSVGPETVRIFRGTRQGRADKGLIITTGTFTSEARKEATRDGAPAIDLIEGEALCLLMRDLGLGVLVRKVEILEVTVDPDFLGRSYRGGDARSVGPSPTGDARRRWLPRSAERSKERFRVRSGRHGTGAQGHRIDSRFGSAARLDD